jgi:hypothetical protein
MLSDFRWGLIPSEKPRKADPNRTNQIDLPNNPFDVIDPN